ncbi:hypothetical protein KVR01_011745 [Diaporthe batatas]|uniref:uncharacterized protein n=1 Tax=Diaporthe batatas TaxID=748121 RepID=UPI001D052368|nr:uncharacterized protein KVR01_011745 [Diaporthe batatas]KAG8158623.1 hypothetical protein KVR01_011745 [Diaporthe batatas]
MDPFSAIGLAGNIVGFLDFGFKLLAKAREIQASSSGAAAANESLVSLTQRFQQVTASLRAQKVTGAAAGEELAIQELAAECDGVAIELLELVHGLRARTPRSKRESLRAAFREWRKGDQKDELALRLDSCRSHLHLQLTSLMSPGTARSRGSSQDDGWIGSPQAHSATLSIGHDCGSTGKNVSMDDTGDSVSHEDDECSSIASYIDFEHVTSADQMSTFSASQISQSPSPSPPIPARQPGPFSPSRSKDVPDELWRVMKKARDDFIAWLEHDHGIFHISGKPGSGKSTLMKYLYKHNRTMNHLRTWAGDENLSIGDSFSGDPARHSRRASGGWFVACCTPC